MEALRDHCPRTLADMDLREVAAGLYAVAAADFMAERTAAAGRADGDLARRIRALRKPTAAAAAVNALVRDDPGLVEAILDVGEQMRTAFAERDRAAIRALTTERQRLLRQAVLASEQSPAVRRDVEATLQAAVVDRTAAAAVRSGMLVHAIESTGVEDVDIGDAVALPMSQEDGTARTAGAARPHRKTGTALPADPEPVESASERRERARQRRAAERAVERARAEAADLDNELDHATERRGEREAEREALERRLDRAAADLAESRAAERALRARLADAQQVVRGAEARLRELPRE